MIDIEDLNHFLSNFQVAKNNYMAELNPFPEEFEQILIYTAGSIYILSLSSPFLLKIMGYKSQSQWPLPRLLTPNITSLFWSNGVASASWTKIRKLFSFAKEYAKMVVFVNYPGAFKDTFVSQQFF